MIHTIPIPIPIPVEPVTLEEMVQVPPFLMALPLLVLVVSIVLFIVALSD